MVYVGEENVVHVAKSWSSGVMRGTLKKVSIHKVIKDDDLGKYWGSGNLIGNNVLIYSVSWS